MLIVVYVVHFANFMLRQLWCWENGARLGVLVCQRISASSSTPAATTVMPAQS